MHNADTCIAGFLVDQVRISFAYDWNLSAVGKYQIPNSYMFCALHVKLKPITIIHASTKSYYNYYYPQYCLLLLVIVIV